MKLTPHKMRAAAIAAVAAAALLLTACSGGSTPAASNSAGGNGGGKVTTIRIAYTPGAGDLQVYLAEKLGFFANHNLNVVSTQGTDLPTWIAALDKQYDVVLTSSGLFLSGATKFDLTAVAGIQVNSSTNPNSSLIARSSSIKSIKDLAGKRVGMATITGATPASLQYLMKQAGGDPKSMTFIPLPFGQQADQLKAGQVDAVVSANPYFTQLLADKANHVVYDDVQAKSEKELVPSVKNPANVFFVSTNTWAGNNKAAIKQFRAALQDGIDYMNKNPEKAKQYEATFLGLDPSIIAKAPIPAVSSTVTAADLKPVIQLYLKMGIITQDSIPDLSKHVLP